MYNTSLNFVYSIILLLTVAWWKQDIMNNDKYLSQMQMEHVLPCATLITFVFGLNILTEHIEKGHK